jgi:hypothetical protein
MAIDLEAELGDIIEDVLLDERVACSDYIEKVESLIVTAQAMMLRLMEQNSRYTTDVQTDLEIFIVDGTMFKSLLTAAFDNEAAMVLRSDYHYKMLLARWAEFTSVVEPLLQPSQDMAADDDDDELDDDDNEQPEASEV